MKVDNKKWIETIFKLFLIYITIPSFKKTEIIEIDNIIKEPLYQNDITFFPLVTKYKILAIYFPPYYLLENYSYHKKSYHEIIKDKYDDNLNKSLIVKQVKLAKNHGIFGFGIVQNLAYNIKVNKEIFNLFLYDSEIKFPFFIIFDYDMNCHQQRINYLIQNETFYRNKLIKQKHYIQKCFLSKEYIKLKGNPILGFFESSFFSKNVINIIRNFENEVEGGKIYIISITYKRQKQKIPKINEQINSTVEYPPLIARLEKSLNEKYFYNFYYNNLKIINAHELESNITKFFIINGSKPEKFYIIFKQLLSLLEMKTHIFILFNAWNDYKKNMFLEPKEKFGYSYLNYFSKAIFNISNDDKYELESLINKCKIAVQVHLFYQDLIEDIINKTNNIPVKFDLLISISNPKIYNFSKNYIKKYTKARYFEIFIAENKGRDIAPFLNQIKRKLKFYKYLCHIHTKKTKHHLDLGIIWRNYLYNNLLGNGNIITKILNDFESNKKIGFIFPEPYYRILEPFLRLENTTKYWMDFLANKLFPNYKIGNLTNFPAGNMFWSKISAIHQIFECDLNEYFPKENNQTESTIMHAIERIWLYLVKYNGFYYKEIFYYF